MKPSLSIRLYTGFTLAILLVLFVGLMSYRSYKNQIRQAERVEHSGKVISSLKHISQMLVDMETARRGYRNTNVRNFLEPYYSNIENIAPSILLLKELVAGKAAQRKFVQRLEQDVDSIMIYWESIGTNTLFAPEEKIAITWQEKALMDQVRVDIEAMVRYEENLLQAQKADYERIERTTFVILIGGIALILIVVAALIVVIASEFRSRVRAEQALKDNLAELERVNISASEKNWLLTGTAEMNNSLQGMNNLSALAQSFLGAIIRYLHMPAGAFYHYDGHKLKLIAGLGLASDVQKTFVIGEGMPGQAAKAKNITTVSSIPSDYWRIASSSGNSVPGSIVFVPVYFNNELKGLIELAAWGSVEKREIDLLHVARNNFGIAINAAEAGEKIMRLLEQVQQQRDELESQQEELQQTNEELTRQSEILQASEEELRVQEEELRQINAELEEKNEAVEMARQALAEKAKELELSSRYKSDFLANMSHELRTPLNSILILANLLAENKTQNLTEKQMEYARIIHRSGADLLKLINDILDLSKIEAGKVEMHFENTSVHDLMEETTQPFRLIAEQKGIKLLTHTDIVVPSYIYTDKQRLGQILKNLLSNAVKFTATGEVRLQVSMVSTQQIAFSVTDTGIGISAEKQTIIFEAFQQVDSSTSRKFGGTGLGLSISRELVKKLFGTIKLDSEEGKGSCFTVVLPLLSEEAVHAVSGAAQHVQPAQGKEKLILIVEDDPAFASVVKDFAEQKNFKTLMASSGDEGLAMAKQYKPAAIILDVHLPVMDGWTMLKILKQENGLKDIPVHIISGDTKPRHIQEELLGYTQKPVNIRALEAAFQNISRHLQNSFKKLLVITTDQKFFENIRTTAGAHLDLQYSLLQHEEALQPNKAMGIDCVVLDVGEEITKGIQSLKTIKQKLSPHVPVIVCINADISPEEEMELKKNSMAIIRNSAQAQDRLMDELQLFFNKIQQPQKLEVPGAVISIPNGSLKDKKALIVDDDMRNVFALNGLLEEQGMQVITASDGKDALRKMNEHPDVNIVLMDIMMPEMDGYEATRTIRNDQRFQKLPIIALTAKAMSDDRQKCLEAGASDYISKPVDNAKLLSLMSVWLT